MKIFNPYGKDREIEAGEIISIMNEDNTPMFTITKYPTFVLITSPKEIDRISINRKAIILESER